MVEDKNKAQRFLQKNVIENGIRQKDFSPFCSVKICGKYVKVIQSQKWSNGSPIRKLDKEKYVDKRTGEIGYFNHQEKRVDNEAYLTKTFGNLRDTVNANVTDDCKNLKWITLTYAENMQDEKRLYSDLDKFYKKFRYHYGDFEYISAIEPQERGAWHCHLLLFFPDKAPFIHNKKIAEMWQHGFTKTQKVDNVTNIGAYLTAYLTNVLGEDGNSKKKARLHLYPASMRPWRASRGIKKPTKYKTHVNNVEKLVKPYQVTYVTNIVTERENFINEMVYMVFDKTLPPPNQKEQSKEQFKEMLRNIDIEDII